MTDGHANKRREFQDGLPLKAQFVYALSSWIAGTSVAFQLHESGVDVGLALPLGLLLGIAGVTVVTVGFWYLYCRGMVTGGETQCTNCGYEWEYSGDLMMTTCPSCQRKTEVDEDG